jgi:hypothetical protein
LKIYYKRVIINKHIHSRGEKMIIAFLATILVACGEKAEDSAAVEEVEETQTEDTSSETEEETEDTSSEEGEE